MSIRLFKIVVSSLKQNLSRSSNVLKSGISIRSIAAMEAPESDQSSPGIIACKNHTRYKQRLKRQWESNDKKENGASDEKKVCDKPFERIKKKKMAMLLGYCGVDYYGMQRNPGVITIEGDLFKALYEAKYITEEDFNNPQNAQFQRSSRTDKGVSAARQVVSLKLPLEVNVEEINKNLPGSIRVFAIKRATNKFNSKSKCNARTYSYTLPTYVFDPNVREEDRKLYRLSAEKMTKVNEVLAVYKGTKSYHNFTEKKHYQDPSALRYMMSFTLERVFMESEMEFAELLVKGQSFMIHQIRKMVGLMIAIVRGHTDMGIMEKAFSKDKVMIPTAPGLGLILDKVHYERYDAKFKDSHDSLTWDSEEEMVQRFKRDQILPSIIKGEIEDNSMGLWLMKIKNHSYEPNEETADDKNDIDFGGDDDDDTEVKENEGNSLRDDENDKNEGGKVSDRNEYSAVSDKNDYSAVSDKNEGGTVSDRNDYSAVSDKNEGGTVSDRNDYSAVSDKNEGVTVSDRNDCRAVSDKNEGGTVSDRNDVIDNVISDKECKE